MCQIAHRVKTSRVSGLNDTHEAWGHIRSRVQSMRWGAKGGSEMLWAAAGVIVRAECLWEQVLSFINRWQVTVPGKYSRPPPPPSALFARNGVFRGRATVTVCLPTQCQAQCLFLVTVHSGVSTFCSHFTHLSLKKTKKSISLKFIFPLPLHLFEVIAIISLFGLQGIRGPRGTFHFYFSSFQLIVAHWGCEARRCGVIRRCHQVTSVSGHLDAFLKDEWISDCDPPPSPHTRHAFSRNCLLARS